MKRDNTIEQFRGPKARVNTKMSIERSTKDTKMPIEGSTKGKGKQTVGYDEMIPGSPKHEISVHSKYFIIIIMSKSKC